MIVAHSSEIEIKKTLILKRKRLDLLGSESNLFNQKDGLRKISSLAGERGIQLLLYKMIGLISER